MCRETGATSLETDGEAPSLVRMSADSGQSVDSTVAAGGLEESCMAVERITIPQIQRMKDEGKKLVVMTAYDYELARIVDRAGPEMILVGDSGGRHCLGYEDFAAVTMEDMIFMTRSARRGAQGAVVVGDMPFMSYQVSTEDAVRNAGRLVKEAGADAVKLEGGEDFAPQVRAIVKA